MKVYKTLHVVFFWSNAGAKRGEPLPLLHGIYKTKKEAEGQVEKHQDGQYSFRVDTRIIREELLNQCETKELET